MRPQLVKTACDILTSAISHLVSSRNPQGHWGDIRSTALACWAINETLLESPEEHSNDNPFLSSVVEDARTWLVGQAKREEGGLSWESEAWDTSLAILALVPDRKYSERIDLATAWLHRIADASTGCWYHEIWETTLTVAALLRRENLVLGPRNEDVKWLERALSWLCTIPSKTSGEYVCPHYSGFLVWLHNELREAPNRNSIESSVFNEFCKKADLAENWLIQVAKQRGASLWTGYTFANSYILYSLSRGPSFSRLQLPQVINWFKRRQGLHGGFEDVEDTALAILALGSAIFRSGIPSKMVVPGTIFSDSLRCHARLKCFLGYSGGSKALALELKEFLSQMLPILDLTDWRWDFLPGRHLFSEIESASKDCRLAIFLVTKDDNLSYDDGMVRPSPRDNIIFEIGFFAARIGIENTILVVEVGTKIPADLGGILYIPLRQRNEISHVTIPLLSTVRRILSECHSCT
jgi:hypothetical protein